MKRRLIGVLLVLLFTATTVFGATLTCRPTTQLDDDAACVAAACHFYGIAVITDGTYAVTVDIYDNASAASGTKLIPTWVIPTSATNLAAGYDAPVPIRCKNGIYVDVTCTGDVKYIVYYSR